MQRIDVLLIQPPLPSPYDKAFVKQMHWPPLNLAYIAAYLRVAGYEVKILDMNLPYYKWDSLQKILTEGTPDFVGITCLTRTFPRTLEVAKYVKEVLPQSIIILGGAYATFCDKEIIENHPDLIDYVVRGEGEHTIVDLLGHLTTNRTNTVRTVKGITFREHGEIIRNNDRPFIQDLDELPYPARDLLDLKKYYKPGTVLSTRGCPFACKFCSEAALHGGRYRIRTPRNVIGELLMMNKNFNLKEFFFIDNSFTVNRKRTFELLKLIKDYLPTIRWGCETRVDLLDEELLREMRETGCELIELGIESGSQPILDKMGKKIKKDQVVKVVKIANDLGILTQCSFIIGHPFDTEDTIKETVHFADSLVNLGSEVFFGMLIPHPGTEYYKKMDEYGIKLEDNDLTKFIFTNAIISTRYLTKQQIFAHWLSALELVAKSSKEQHFGKCIRVISQ